MVTAAANVAEGAYTAINASSPPVTTPSEIMCTSAASIVSTTVSTLMLARWINAAEGLRR